MNNSPKSVGIIIIGGSGYGAKELIKIGLNHPEIDICSIVSRTNSGELVSSIHKELFSLTSLSFSKEADFSLLNKYKNKFVLLALPHEESEKFVYNNYSETLSNKICIIDLSGAFRLKNRNERSKYYGQYPSEVTDEIINSFEYGLSEINKSKIISSANISNPGCFATAAILSTYPLRTLKISNIAIDGKSGSSGAGRGLKQIFHHPELSGSSFPYAVLKHRHLAEILEYGINKNSKKIPVAFTPHVIPISRGMLVTSYIFLNEPIKKDQILEFYKSSYKDSPFIRLIKDPSEIRHVAGSNFSDIYVEVKENMICVSASIDNLVKGMAGQAIQNINIKSGLKESSGLEFAGIGLI